MHEKAVKIELNIVFVKHTKLQRRTCFLVCDGMHVRERYRIGTYTFSVFVLYNYLMYLLFFRGGRTKNNWKNSYGSNPN